MILFRYFTDLNIFTNKEQPSLSFTDEKCSFAGDRWLVARKQHMKREKDRKEKKLNPEKFRKNTEKTKHKKSKKSKKKAEANRTNNKFDLVKIF